MPETIYKLEAELTVNFWMRNRHRRPTDADIQEEGTKWAKQKAELEDMKIVKIFEPTAVFYGIEFIRYENPRIEQHQTPITNERHWQANPDCIYYVLYTK
ncbi:MAG: hypothetical protein ACLR2K_01800 [Paraclostridium sordellii]